MLPNRELAIVPLEKLRDYCLNPAHARGRHKAKVFLAALGIGATNAGELHDALMEAARTVPATEGESDRHGTRYVIDFELKRGLRAAMVRSVWIVRLDGIPRLTTCFVH